MTKRWESFSIEWEPMFTRGGSFRAEPPIAPELVNCLLTFRERRLRLASLQMTPESPARHPIRGPAVFEEFVEIFAETASGEIIESQAEKPLSPSKIREIYNLERVKWSFAISTLTFRRPAPPIDTPGIALADAAFSTISHAVVAFDLVHRRLAGASFVPTWVPGVEGYDPQVMVIIAAENLANALRETTEVVHIVSPLLFGEELEFLPWLLYGLRAADVRQAIVAASAVPEEFRLSIEEILFWGLPGNFHDVDGRTTVYPRTDRPGENLLIGVNFGFTAGADSIDFNFRLCDSGAARGFAPHIDIQLNAKAIESLHGRKLANHVAVDLSRFEAFGLGHALTSYVGDRPGAAVDRMVGAGAASERLGPMLLIAKDSAVQARVKEILGLDTAEYVDLLGRFNAVYRVDLAMSRDLEAQINDTVATLWASADTPAKKQLVIDGLVRLHRERLLDLREFDDSPTVAHGRLMTVGQRALAAFRTIKLSW